METNPETPFIFPRIGSPAPPFEAVTSMGILKLEGRFQISSKGEEKL